MEAAATRDTRLLGMITGNGILRVASGASAVLAGVYIADLNRQGVPMDAGLVGDRLNHNHEPVVLSGLN